MGYRIVVDIVLHVSGKTAAVQLFRVLEETEPAAFQALADKTGFLPDGFLQLLAGIFLQAGDGPAQGSGGSPQRDQTLEQTDQRDNRNGTVYNIISDVRKDRRYFRKIRQGIRLPLTKDGVIIS